MTFFVSFVFVSPSRGNKRIQSLNGTVNRIKYPGTGCYGAVRNNMERIDTATGAWRAVNFLRSLHAKILTIGQCFGSWFARSESSKYWKPEKFYISNEAFNHQDISTNLTFSLFSPFILDSFASPDPHQRILLNSDPMTGFARPMPYFKGTVAPD